MVAKGEDLMDKGRGQGMAADTGRGSSGRRISNSGGCARSSSGLRRDRRYTGFSFSIEFRFNFDMASLLLLREQILFPFV
jgi:hypothetical protein